MFPSLLPLPPLRPSGRKPNHRGRGVEVEQTNARARAPSLLHLAHRRYLGGVKPLLHSPAQQPSPPPSPAAGRRDPPGLGLFCCDGKDARPSLARIPCLSALPPSRSPRLGISAPLILVVPASCGFAPARSRRWLRGGSVRSGSSLRRPCTCTRTRTLSQRACLP